MKKKEDTKRGHGNTKKGIVIRAHNTYKNKTLKERITDDCQLIWNWIAIKVRSAIKTVSVFLNNENTKNYVLYPILTTLIAGSIITFFVSWLIVGSCEKREIEEIEEAHISSSFSKIEMYFGNRMYDDVLEICLELEKEVSAEGYENRYIDLKKYEGDCYYRLAQEDDKESYIKSIESYRAALELCNEDKHFEKYGNIKNNIGCAYIGLYEITESKDDLDRAANALKTAFEVRSTLENRYDLSNTQSNLAQLYYLYALRDGKRANIIEAFNKYEMSLSYFTLKDYPDEYALNQVRLGASYEILSDFEDRKGNLNKSIDAYNEALKVMNVEDYPLDYAKIHYSIGGVYLALSHLEEPQENCRESIAEFEEAMKIYTKDEYPRMYGVILCSIAHSHLVLSQNQNRRGNIDSAISNFLDALEILRIGKYPYNYAEAQNGLGIAFWYKAGVENGKVNLEKAIGAHKEALKVFTYDKHRENYGHVQNEIGNCYYGLASIENKEENAERAIIAYRESIKVFSIDTDYLNYLVSQYNIGQAYELLSEATDKKGNLEKARDAYKSGMKVCNNEEKYGHIEFCSTCIEALKKVERKL